MNIDIRTVQLSLRDAKTGAVSYQPDYYGAGPTDDGEKPGGNALPSAMPYGLVARPLDPSGTDPANLEACECIVFEAPDDGRIMPTTDPRYIALAPDPGAGGSGLFAVTDPGSGGHKDATTLLLEGSGLPGVTPGSFRLRVPYADGTKVHIIEVDLAVNKIRLVHGDGPKFEIGPTGVNFTGAGQPIAMAGASSVDLSGPGGQQLVINPGVLNTAFVGIQTLFDQLGKTFQPPPINTYAATKATAL